jgi:hypothetical protein
MKITFGKLDFVSVFYLTPCLSCIKLYKNIRIYFSFLKYDLWVDFNWYKESRRK